MVDRRARFRTLSAATLGDARRQRQALQRAARISELPLSPRLTFAEVADRWLAEFEAKVAAVGRREQTLDLYRSQLRRHVLPRRGRRRLHSITPDDVVASERALFTACAPTPSTWRPVSSQTASFGFARASPRSLTVEGDLRGKAGRGAVASALEALVSAVPDAL